MRHCGFTLLEMIVVLAILGLATALVAPSAIRGIDSWRRQSELDSLLDQIRALPGDARASGKAITPWKVNANGVCEGGVVEIGNDHGKRSVVVTPPFCDPAVQP